MEIEVEMMQVQHVRHYGCRSEVGRKVLTQPNQTELLRMSVGV